MFLWLFNKVRYLYHFYSFREFGRNSFIARPNIAITGKRNIEIGSRSYIGKNARIEAVLQYNKRKLSPLIVIGDDVCINQNFHCTCGLSVTIGNGTSITANCGIFDIIHPYYDIKTNPRMADIEMKTVRIGQNCLIGMNSVLLPGTILGDHCVVGANSTLSKEYPS